MKLFAPQKFYAGLGISSIFFVIAKAVGYLRQLILAYHFGITRELDIYLMTYAITMLVTSSFALWFDQMAIPRLVQVKTESDEKFRRMCASVFTLSIMMGLVLCIALVLLAPLLTLILSKGFSAVEQEQVRSMVWYFLPWVLLIFPYNALTAILKCMRYYSAVSVADLAVSVLSTAGFFLWHSNLIALPLTLAAGYGIVLSVLMLLLRGKVSMLESPFHGDMTTLYRDFKHMFVVNQMVFVIQGFDRFYQSFLLPGSIATYSYVNQLVTPIYEFLAFDEIFLVPISAAENRVVKTNRLIAGLLLLATPIAVFLYFEAPLIIETLYQRGKFGPSATHLAAQILQILAIGFVVGSLSTPLTRVLQVTNGILSIGWSNAVTSGTVIVLNFFFILKFKFDLIGLATSVVCSIYVGVFYAFYLLHRRGVQLHYVSFVKYFLWAFVVSFVCRSLAGFLPIEGPAFLKLMSHAAMYGLLLSGFYWLLRNKIQKIIYGERA